MQDDHRHNENDSSLVELRDLLADFTTGELTGDQNIKLEKLVTESEAAWQFYLEYMFLYGSVQQEYSNRGKVQFPPAPPSNNSNSKESTDSPASNDSIFPLLEMENHLLSSDDVDAFGASKTPAPSDAPASGLFDNFNLSFVPALITIVSAVLILSVVVILPIYRSMHSEKVSWDIVARVVHTVDCQWKENSMKPTTGSFLAAGQKLELELGLTELEFANGVRVILEGPAEFTIAGYNSSNLALGRLAATVPDGAQGFTVETPDLEIVDLGTEFGVEVEEGGNTDVHVFKGVVETKVLKTGVAKSIASVEQTTKPLSQSRTLRLEKNQAVQYRKASKEVVTIPANRHHFVRSLDKSKGITENLVVKNPSFELPDIRTRSDFQKEQGNTQFCPIYGWKVSDSGQGKTKVAMYQISPYDSPTTAYNVGPGATDGRQVITVSLCANSVFDADHSRSSWIYQSLGTITSADLGKTLKLSADAGPCSSYGKYFHKDGTIFVGFATHVTPEQRGTTVGTPGVLRLGKEKIKQLRCIEASLAITPNLVGQELFMLFVARDQNKGIYQYHFDNVEVVVED